MTLYLTLASATGEAEVVLRLDRRRHLFAEHYRLRRGVDVHLELGLLVLLDPERAAAVVVDHDLVNAQSRVGGQLERPVKTAEAVGLEFLGQHLLALGIVDLDGEGLVGEVRGVGLVVAGVGHPELELHRLTGAIDGAVGDRVNLDLVVSRVLVSRHQTWVKPKMGKPACRGPCGAEPLVMCRVVVQGVRRA